MATSAPARTPTSEMEPSLKPAPLKTPAREAGASHPQEKANTKASPAVVAPKVDHKRITANAVADAIRKLELEQQGTVTRDTKDLRQECKRGLRKGKGRKRGSCTCPLCLARGEVSVHDVDENAVELLIDACKKKGFDVSKTYTKQLLSKHGGLVLPALMGIQEELSTREVNILATGRIAWEREKLMAEKAGYKTRDQVVAYIENDDQCLKEFQQHGSQSAYGKSVAKLGNRENRQRWTQMYTEETQFRDERAKYYRDMLKCLHAGVITQDDMNERMQKYDGMDSEPEEGEAHGKAPGNCGHGNMVANLRRSDGKVTAQSTVENPDQTAIKGPYTATVEDEDESEESDMYESDPCNYDSDTYTDPDFDPLDYVSDENSDAWSENEDVVANIKNFAVALNKVDKKGPPTLEDFEDARDTLLRRYRTKLSRLVITKLFICDACDGRFSSFKELRSHVAICDAPSRVPRKDIIGKGNSTVVRTQKSSKTSSGQEEMVFYSTVVPAHDFIKGAVGKPVIVDHKPTKKETSFPKIIPKAKANQRSGTATIAKTDQVTKATPQVQQGTSMTIETENVPPPVPFPNFSDYHPKPIDEKEALRILLEANDKTFSDDESLERCGPYQCDRCGGIFDNFKTLSSHLRKARSKCKDFYQALYKRFLRQPVQQNTAAAQPGTGLEPRSQPLVGSKHKAQKISLHLDNLVRELRIRGAHEYYLKTTSEMVAQAQLALEQAQVLPQPIITPWVDPTVTEADGIAPPRYVDDELGPHMFPSFIDPHKNINFTDCLPPEETDAALKLDTQQKKLHERLRQIHRDVVNGIVDQVEDFEIEYSDNDEIDESDLVNRRMGGAGDYSKEAVDHVVALCPLLYKRSLAVAQMMLCGGSAALATDFTQKMLHEIQMYLTGLGEQHVTLRAVERECWRFGMSVQHYCQFGSYEPLDPAISGGGASLLG